VGDLTGTGGQESKSHRRRVRKPEFLQELSLQEKETGRRTRPSFESDRGGVAAKNLVMRSEEGVFRTREGKQLGWPHEDYITLSDDLKGV